MNGTEGTENSGGIGELQKITFSLHEVITKKWTTLDAAEEAFVKSAAVTEYALIMNALAAWQIADRKLYQPRFKTLESYLMGVKERLGVSRAYFFERMKIAEAYMQYREPLYAAGFREDRDASNLRLFFKAQKAHGTEAAIRNLPRMSFREYQRWVNGTQGETVDRGVEEKLEISREGIRYEGQLLISAQQIARIFQDGEEPFMIGVRSDAEKRALSRYLRARREKGG
jgi:hypothetical protein